MEKTSKIYQKACKAIMEVKDSEELLALRFLAGSLAEVRAIEEREAVIQPVDSVDGELICPVLFEQKLATGEGSCLCPIRR